MMNRILLLSLMLLTICSRVSQASCGSANCPLNMHKYVGRGSLQLGLVHEYINMDHLYLGSSKSYVGAISGHHDEVQTINQRDVIQLKYGMFNRFGLNLDVPFIHREHSHIGHENGQNAWEYWNFSGLGDLTVSGQIGLLLPATEFQPYLSLTIGLKLPTGLTDAKNADGELAEVTIQPGTGSLDVLLGANYRQSFFHLPTFYGQSNPVPLSLGVSYQINGRGTDDYRFGNVTMVHLGTEYQLLNRVGMPLQVNGRFQDYADVGSTDEPRGNTGGTWIFFSPGLNISITDTFSGYSFVQIPVYQNVHGLQQTARFNLQFGLTASVSII